MKGIVTSIQSMCYDDGPGLRTTVFLKGCPLHCFWCHNPESLSSRPQIAWYRAKCIGCGVCVKVCPTRLRTAPGAMNAPVCESCGECVSACSGFALEKLGTEWDVSKLAEYLEKDKAFFIQSGGGVTLSGGEPLLQWQFSTALLELLRGAGIHTAIETSGFAPADAFRTVADAADLVIMDLKHHDSAAHKRVTGGENGRILENFSALAASGKPCIIRTPVIPGVNDSEEDIRTIAAIASRARGLIRYELMPYHALGTGKLESLGKDTASVPALTPIPEEKLSRLREIACEAGGSDI